MVEEVATPLDEPPSTERVSVFSSVRQVDQPPLALPPGLAFDCRLEMEGLRFLGLLPSGAVPVAFLDPQYRGVLDHLAYGNEGVLRGAGRASLPQMTDDIPSFIREIDRCLMRSGHLFLWTDKYHLCTGIGGWLEGTSLEIVDMVTWHKKRIGMGYRTRRASEHLIVLQKAPRKAKGVWKVHTIPDVWSEAIGKRDRVHPKPVGLQSALIEAVSNPGDVVIDPAAGSFSVMEACRQKGRTFLGCDING